MPDNKPMTPEEFAERLKSSEGRYFEYMIEARDESIRREAKREERNDICRWLSGDCTWPEGKQLAEDIQCMSAKLKHSRPLTRRQPQWKPSVRDAKEQDRPVRCGKIARPGSRKKSIAPTAAAQASERNNKKGE